LYIFKLYRTFVDRIKIHNRTNYEIPLEVIDLLSLGKNRGIGSFTDESCQNYIEIDKLKSEFQKIARKNDISEIDMFTIYCLY
jgi:hypothetical protein